MSSRLIKIRLNIFRCFLLSTYYFILMHQDFIHWTANNIIILLIPVKFISWYRIFPVVLSMYDFNIIRTKVSHELELIWWMPRAMYKTGFWTNLQMVYIYFSLLHISLTHHGVSIWRGIFYSIFPAVTSMGVICPSILFIRILYYTFIDILHNIHAFKHVKYFIKSSRLAVKTLYIWLLAPTIKHNI